MASPRLPPPTWNTRRNGCAPRPARRRGPAWSGPAPAADVEYPEERLRAESGAAPGPRWIGTGSAVERLWARPAITVTGLDAPKVAGASNTLVPVARARVTVRLAPGDTSANALTRLL